MPNPSKILNPLPTPSKYSTPSDFEDAVVHPELEDGLRRHRNTTIPTLYDEMGVMAQAKKNLFKKARNDPYSARVFGKHYWDAFNRYQRLSTELYLNKLKLWQTYPDDKNVKNTLLHHMASNYHWPYESLFADKETGLHSISIPPAFRTGEGGYDRIPINLDEIPRYSEAVDGTQSYELRPLNAEETLLFPNTKALHSAVGPFWRNIINLNKASNDEVAQRYNALMDDPEHHVDASMMPPPTRRPLVGRIVEDGVLELDINNLNFFKRAQEDLNKDVDALGGTVDKPVKPPTGGGEEELVPIDFKAEQLKRDKEIDDYWLNQMPGSKDIPEVRERWGVRRHLINEIVKRQFQDRKIDPEEYESIAKLAGAASRFVEDSGIKVDKTGLGILGGTSSAAIGTSGVSLDNKAVSAITKFVLWQQGLLADREPERWSLSGDKGFMASTGDGLVESILKRMQTMMINRDEKTYLQKGGPFWNEHESIPANVGSLAVGGAYAKGALKGWKALLGWSLIEGLSPDQPVAPHEQFSRGIQVPDNLDPDDYVRILDTLEMSSAFGNGMGIQGSSPRAMDELVTLIAQYFEWQNQSALQGDRIKKFSERADTHYKDKRGRAWMYDFRKRLGGTEVSPDMWKEVGGNSMDPVYNLIKDFIHKGENLVVIAGTNGEKIVPLVQYMGLDSRQGTFFSPTEYKSKIPLRIHTVKLVGTDVKSERDVVENLDSHWKILGRPIKNWVVQGEGSTKPISQTFRHTPNKDVTDLLAAEKNKELDTNDDGVVDAKERKAGRFGRRK